MSPVGITTRFPPRTRLAQVDSQLQTNMLSVGVDHLSGRDSVLLCSRDSLAKLKLDPSWDRDRPSVFFCIGLSQTQIQQSGFLEGVSETAGVTELPQDISQDDFLLWLKHCCPPFRPPPANEKVARLINVRLLSTLHLLPSCRHERGRPSSTVRTRLI